MANVIDEKRINFGLLVDACKADDACQPAVDYFEQLRHLNAREALVYFSNDTSDPKEHAAWAHWVVENWGPRRKYSNWFIELMLAKMLAGNLDPPLFLRAWKKIRDRKNSIDVELKNQCIAVFQGKLPEMEEPEDF